MSNKHRNDIYGNLEQKQEGEGVPAIPAATVVILKDGDSRSGSPDAASGHPKSILAVCGFSQAAG